MNLLYGMFKSGVILVNKCVCKGENFASWLAVSLAKYQFLVVQILLRQDQSVAGFGLKLQAMNHLYKKKSDKMNSETIHIWPSLLMSFFRLILAGECLRLHATCTLALISFTITIWKTGKIFILSKGLFYSTTMDAVD